MLPIDLVYTWVDGNDSVHASKRRSYSKKNKGLNPEANNVARYRSNNELQESIRSALTFLPWIHKIYIVVADGQRPSNLPQDSRISIVPHSKIYGPYTSHLPTFNSHSIEAHLFRIPGLSNQFIYSNDDTFFGKPLSPHFFFMPDGRPKAFMNSTFLRSGNPTKKTPPYQAAHMNVNNVLNRVYKSKRRRRKFIHQARPVSKELYEMAWKHPIFGKHLQSSSSSKFRTKTDVEPVCLILHIGLETRRAVPGSASQLYTRIQDRSSLGALFNRINKGYQLYCINDTMSRPTKKHLEQYRNGLRSRLPHHLYSKNSSEIPSLSASNLTTPRGGWKRNRLGRRVGRSQIRSTSQRVTKVTPKRTRSLSRTVIRNVSASRKKIQTPAKIVRRRNTTPHVKSAKSTTSPTTSHSSLIITLRSRTHMRKLKPRPVRIARLAERTRRKRKSRPVKTPSSKTTTKVLKKLRLLRT